VNSYPYDDPANKKAPLKQLKNIMETLDGFLGNEAPALASSSDPAVQLPLQTANSDLQRLKDEVSVIDRNPGIEGTLTIGDLNGINANLAFLQKKWRLSANNEVPVEGFQNKKSWLDFFGGWVEDFGGKSEGFVNPGSSTNLPETEIGGIEGDVLALGNIRLTGTNYEIYTRIPVGTGGTGTGGTNTGGTGTDGTNTGGTNPGGTNPGGTDGSPSGSLPTLQWTPILVPKIWKADMLIKAGTSVYMLEGTSQNLYVAKETTNSTPSSSNTAWKKIGTKAGPLKFVSIQSSMFNQFVNINSITSTTGGSYIQGSIAMYNGLYYILTASANGNLEWTLISGPVAYTGIGDYPAGKVIYLRNRKTYITTEVLDSNDPAAPEGFQSSSNNQWVYIGSYSGAGSGSNPFDVPAATTTTTTTSTTGSPGSAGSNGKISLVQLKKLSINISSFITQLENSGTVNAIINQRINTLKILLRQVLSYESQVETGKMKESDIPIKFTDYQAFLPYVDINDPQYGRDKPLPYLLSATESDALSNLFPFFFSGDISGAKLARELFDKYAKNLFTDVGYDVNVKLNKKSDSERKVAEEVAKALANGTLGKNSKLAFDNEGDEDGDMNGKAPSSVTGMFNSIIQAITGQNSGQDSTADSGSSSVKVTTNSPPSAPGHFNWKDRSKEICDQVKKRGLNAYEYGCLNNPDEVSENFSYRGYARMICARLETNYDPSIPTLCGCPPPTWPGWRP
jgi:hypothetical protein